MFPSPEQNHPVCCPPCRYAPENWRLLLALGLSVLAHALSVLPINFEAMRGGNENAWIKPGFSARLVSAPSAKSPEKIEHLEAISEKKSESTEKFLQSDSSVVPPASPSDKEYSPELGLNPGNGIGAPEIRYFSSDLLTVRPYPLTILESPERLEPLPDDSAGRVVLKVWISDTGEVTATETEFTDMPATIQEAIVAAFQGMRFMPGKIDGKAVGSIMRIEMTYEDFRLPVQY
jgi:hypothetical protein